METRAFDLVVIGAGPGGYVAAIRAAQLGLQTACVDKEAVLGGTCLRIGCIPSKVLLESSARYQEALTGLAQHGVRVNGVSLDLPAVLQRKDQVVRALTKGIEGLFRKNKITHFQGTASFLSPHEIEVRGQDNVRLQAKHFIIATGSVSAPLPGVELDGERIVTSTEALSFAEVPRRLVVIGAGFIGLELSCVWQRFGAQVTVLEYLNRILPGTDEEIAQEAQKIFTRQGLKFHLNTRVTSARRVGGHCVVEREGAEPLECDYVLLAVGRVPHTAGLGLERLGIALERGRIPVNERFATAVPGVYAIGDVIHGPMLAHKAEEEGIACVEGIVRGHGHVDYDLIPGVVYTHPEIAAVGKTEAQLKERGIPYRKGIFPLLASGRARTLGETEGKIKVLAHAETDRLLGVHLIAPHAGEMIGEAAAAMAFGASAEDLARVCHAHPTLSEALKEAALAVDGRAIHI
ncbi:dihydrolipoyl dehydrogenase [Fontisphaera persica]|uniref:dihydrolipoyl dehydrogenase n=1 Tax=Fontisphaera persica TaxID=2974023 RepID=UPI0024BF8D5E|nr:dihydrolipoyl dehydrogenase [Fontisphaera persica]WCJ59851.1 dihydrolipoyl dehydrogenase [Fontisphaera persica]